MPVVKMQKVRIIGLTEDRETLFEQLQNFELIHLKNFKEKTLDAHFSGLPTDSDDKELREQISHIESTLRYLERFKGKNIISSLFPEKLQVDEEEFEHTISSFDHTEIVNSIKDTREEIAKIEEEISSLQSEISFLLPWGNLLWNPSEATGSRTTKTLFLKCPEAKYSQVSKKLKKIKEIFIKPLSSQERFIYLVLIYWKESEKKISPILKEFGLETVELAQYEDAPSNVINACRRKIQSLGEEKAVLFEKVKQSLAHREKLMIVYDWYVSRLLRERAKSNARQSQQVFILQGWIRENDREGIEKFFKDKFPATYIETISPDKGETPPIEVKNPAVVRPFQAVTNLFGLPRYGEVDPAGLIAPFFFLFFGLCLTDAGYGIVLITLVLLAMRKIKVDEGGKQFFYLFLLCGLATIFWGTITGGWFGIEVKRLPSFLSNMVLLNPMEELMKLFMLALAFGVVQVLLGIGVEMYEQLRDKNFANAFADQFPYIILLPGTIIYVASQGEIVGAQLNKIALYAMLFAGIIMVIASLLKKGRNPIFNLLVSIGGFIWKAKDFLGNVLSYSRLMALGLATTIIALVVNTMAGIVMEMPYIGIIFAVLILVIGHMGNLAINTLGGFVHTTRLQFVEFFSYFFQGGGEAFQPLSSGNKYIMMKSEKTKGGKLWK